jgi:uncharacterized metal-binding protein
MLTAVLAWIFMKKLPLVYACSGCSNVAQMANYMALELTKRGVAEMSCIAGVGGNVAPLVKKAQQADRIIALDGCHLHCVKHCLSNHQIKPSLHLTLSDLGLKKRNHQEFDAESADALIADLTKQLNLEPQAHE